MAGNQQDYTKLNVWNVGKIYITLTFNYINQLKRAGNSEVTRRCYNIVIENI
ncbi:hypothetical protein GCM10010913_20760 [Paenibacillus aceti]|uniref:Integrase SAM-like N-terminal domain-containing protein n=1 Tax=Paenibacillus aceti TaxID=1820010 RepID=A0ABQ1VUT1_9BACL|nr:hypothetical protein GCM10010913_20760 [Paenibacillus aceti]